MHAAVVIFIYAFSNADTREYSGCRHVDQHLKQSSIV